MNNRAYAIDVLRCLAIVGMVFSGQISWLQGLPAWLFHAQVPPPDFAFSPDIPGITWVDLVFPFFLFSMGAAFPLAMRRKLEKGVPAGRIVWDLCKRGGLLALFAIALGNTQSHMLGDSIGGTGRSLMVLGTWVLFFCMFVRFPVLSYAKNRVLNLCGALGIVGLLLFYRYGMGLPVSVRQSDIIILVLANMAVFGTLLWWLTKDNLVARLGVIALVAAMKLTSAVDGSWNQAVWDWSPLPWLFRADFLKYLCIVLPGSVAGDMVWRWMHRPDTDVAKPSRPALAVWAVVMLTAAFLFCMWALLTRHLAINVVVCGLLGAAAWWLLKQGSTGTERFHKAVFTMGFFWLMLGLVLEAYEGGIKKDHATLSYFFVTTGLASYAVVVVSSLLNYWKVNMNFLVRCGQNPMIAYTACGYVVVPVLAILHLTFVLVWMNGLDPWMGVLRGALVTFLMMLVTVGFTRLGWFWKT